MAAICRLNAFCSLTRSINLLKSKELTVRAIATSPKKTVNDECIKSTPKKVWVSYGFDTENEEMDRHAMHTTLFVTVTICLVGGAFVLAYKPDVKLRHWAQREAYLQLRYREENGLLPIDPNLIPPEKVVLPTDEELGDTEIII